MSADKIYFAVERYSGHSAELAAALVPFGVRVERHRDFVCVTEFRAADGDLVREVGELDHLVEGPRKGLTNAWPRSDANETERIVLLRAAEDSQRAAYDFEGWGRRHTATKQYALLTTTILVILEDGNGLPTDRALARVPETVWQRTDRALLLRELEDA